MNRPSVWAPAHTISIVTEHGHDVPAEPIGGGWHRAPADLGDAGYRFLVDGEGPYPDPRSVWQPHGVHGPSYPFDHRRYPWRDDDFVATPFEQAIVYELHVGTFSPAGTFVGAIDRLDHLVDLGITHVELMPVAAFDGRHGWGYDGVALFAPHAPYGPPAELQLLVDECHARGLAVVLDVVYNHLGPSGNYLAAFGPYFTDRHRTPWGPAVNVDGPDSDEVRRFFLDNAAMWLREYHMDGLRLDAMHAVVDTSSIHLLESLRATADDVAATTGRPRVLIVEYDDNVPRLVRPTDAGGFGLDAKWNDDFHHALHVALTGERTAYYRDFDGLADLGTALHQGWVYRGAFSPSRRRSHGRPFERVPRAGAGLVVYQQNHDQIGNRPQGERLSETASLPRHMVGAAITLLSPMVPMLFQGEEWAASTPFPYFADHPDDLARQVSEGRARELADFGWPDDQIRRAPDSEDEATFLAAKLNWDELAKDPHHTVAEWYRQLISIRRSIALDLQPEQVRVTVDAAQQVLTMTNADLAVIANLGDAAATVPVATPDATLVAASDPSVHVAADVIVLPPDSAAVLLRSGGSGPRVRPVQHRTPDEETTMTDSDLAGNLSEQDIAPSTAAEGEGADAAHEPDRLPTPEEERMAEQVAEQVDIESTTAHEKEMGALGANVKGEGEIE